MFKSIFIPVIVFTSALLATACSDGGTTGGGGSSASSGGAGPGATVTSGGGGAPTTVGPGGATSTGSNPATTGATSTATSASSSAGSSSGSSMGMIGPAGGGYLINGEWHGYAWTVGVPSPGTTIMPADFTGTMAGDPLCVSGVVAADPAYGGVAILGVNLNQLAGPNQAVNTVTPMKKGIIVHVTNPSQTSLRLQIQGPNGSSDPKDRWCTPIIGAGGFYPWTVFTTDCWNPMAPGAKYNNEPLVAALVTVPGSNVTTTPFNFCLKDIYEGDADNGGGGVCNPADPPITGSTTAQYGGHLVCGSDAKQYAIWNNHWGANNTNQKISWSGTTFSVDAQPDSSGGVISYPSIFIGSINTFTTTESNLPKQVSALTTVPTSWTHNGGQIGGEYNAAYDVWFNTANQAGLDTPTGGYLMVWLHKPGGKQPIGGQIGTASIAGKQWNVWTGTNSGTGKPCISYVATSDLTTFSFDLNAFIQDATTNHSQYMSASWYLANIFAGFEIWSGGTGLQTTAFSAIVN